MGGGREGHGKGRQIWPLNNGIVSAAVLCRGTHSRPGHVSERCHVEDIVVWEEEEVMGVVEPVNVVQLVLQQVPPLVKLVDR